MSMKVLMLNWRDMGHPEAGGAEKYLVTVAEGLAARGHHVTIRTAAYPGSLKDEVVNGVRYLRSGGRLGIYPLALAKQLLKRDEADVVVDVQNGVPYLTPLIRRRGVVNLVHHVHREQWPVVFGPRLSRLGWWLESQVGPRVYRNSPYVAVSDSTRLELSGLGVDASRIEVIHNGTDTTPLDGTQRSVNPSIIVLGRLVPHKRVELVLEAAANLRTEIPDLTVDVVGSGWWEHHLTAHAGQLGLDDTVTFHGHVSELEKHHLLARAWVHALPSLKEGWGLVVVEAGVHGTPTVAFREAGGPTNSIVHGRTGLLVQPGVDAFTHALRTILVDPEQRLRMSEQVANWVTRFHWDETVDRWEQTLLAVTGHDQR